MTNSTVVTSDGVSIFYKDWGPKDAQPIVFSHGWPLCSDDWDAQMMFFSTMATGSSRTIGAGMAAPPKLPMGMTWITMRTISPP